MNSSAVHNLSNQAVCLIVGAADARIDVEVVALIEQIESTLGPIEVLVCQRETTA